MHILTESILSTNILHLMIIFTCFIADFDLWPYNSSWVSTEIVPEFHKSLIERDGEEVAAATRQVLRHIEHQPRQTAGFKL